MKHKTDLDDMQFTILIRTKTSFKEIMHIKNGSKEEAKQVFKKLGIELDA